MISLLSREASTEVVLEGIVPALLKNLREADVASAFARALAASSGASGPVATIAVPEVDAKQLNALLEDTETLTQVLTLHVVPENLELADLESQGTVTTVNTATTAPLMGREEKVG